MALDQRRVRQQRPQPVEVARQQAKLVDGNATALEPRVADRRRQRGQRILVVGQVVERRLPTIAVTQRRGVAAIGLEEAEPAHLC